MFSHRKYFYFFITLFLFTLLGKTAQSQSEGGTMSFGFNAGGSKYWGEFTDNQFWYGGDVFLRYNIISHLSLHLSAGLTQLRYKLTQSDLEGYSDYFGPNAQIGGQYPNTTTIIEEKNAIRVNTYEAFLSLNFSPHEKFVPYIFGGVGMMNWNPATLIANSALPNNAANKYEKSKIEIPVGIGFEAFLTQNLALNGRGTLRITGTDNLDDYSVAGSKNDAFLTFGIGLSYYIFQNNDWDGDGLTNEEEERLGTDPKNPDTDGDGLTDYEEVKKYHTDPLKRDTDGDGLSDYDEIMKYHTDPLRADTDNDGLNDGDEVSRGTDPLKADTDGDGLSDSEEVNQNHTDPLKPDTDGDGLSDGDEVHLHGTNPLKADTDGDGLSDGDEVLKYKTNPVKADTDGDGLSDGEELNTYHTDPLKADTDGDGLTDGDEVNKYHTDPLKADTDGDGLNDAEEVLKYKTDPLKVDTDGDTLSDFVEVTKTHTDPLNPDTDGDGISDGEDACPLIKGVKSPIKERNGCPEVVKVGTKTDFPDILFIVNTDQFNFTEPATGQNLAKLLGYVNQCPNLRVMIEGHASEEGNAKRNMELSDMRAKKVKQWLVEQGVTPAKIEGTIGYGSSRPKFPEPKGKELKRMSKADLEGIRKQNRRITVVVQHGCD